MTTPPEGPNRKYPLAITTISHIRLVWFSYTVNDKKYNILRQKTRQAKVWVS